jgi:hypothetical protein
MASTYSPKLKFELIGAGEQAGLWGTTTNKNVGELIEQAIAGVTTIDLTGISGDYTLSSLDGTVDQARSAVISCTGAAAAAVNIIIPTSTKLYVFRNACGRTITVKTAAQTGGVALATGEANSVFCNGAIALAGLVTAGGSITPVSAGGTGVNTFTTGFLRSPSPGGTTALTTVASINLATSDTSGTLPVNKGGTGVASVAVGNLLLGGTGGTGAMTALAGISTGHVVTWNGTTWTSQALPASGGTVTSVGTSGSVSGLTLTGGPITSSGTITLGGTLTLTSGQVTSALGYTPGNVSTGTTNNFTGTNNYSTASNIQMSASSSADQRIAVAGSGFSTGISPTSIQLGVSSAGMYWNSSTQAVIVITPSYGENARFFGSGFNTQGNNSANWATVSDINIKTNLRPISDVLGKINALKPCHFEYKDKLGKTQTGFIAQEFATVFPGHTMDIPADDKYTEFLPEGQTDLTAIDANLTAYLVKAIQELSAKVTALEEQVLNLSVK